LQLKFGYTEIDADMYLSTMTLFGAIFSPISGFLMDRYGYRSITVCLGLFLMLFGFTMLVYLSIFPVFAIVLAGIGDGLISNCIYSILAVLVPPEKYGTAYGFMASMYNLAQVLLFYLFAFLYSDQELSIEMIEFLFSILCLLLSVGLLISSIFNIYDYIYNNGICNKPSSIYKPSSSSDQTIGLSK